MGPTGNGIHFRCHGRLHYEPGNNGTLDYWQNDIRIQSRVKSFKLYVKYFTIEITNYFNNIISGQKILPVSESKNEKIVLKL